MLSPRVSFDERSNSCWEFEAEVFMLYITGACVRKGFQATIYVATTKQTAVIEEIKEKVYTYTIIITRMQSSIKYLYRSNL